MTYDKIKSAAVHYALGLLSASWNGGISSVAAILGIDAVAMTGAGSVQENRILNLHEMASAFGGACVIHGILWLKAHPLPEKYEETPAPFPPKDPPTT